MRSHSYIALSRCGSEQSKLLTGHFLTCDFLYFVVFLGSPICKRHFILEERSFTIWRKISFDTKINESISLQCPLSIPSESQRLFDVCKEYTNGTLTYTGLSNL